MEHFRGIIVGALLTAGVCLPATPAASQFAFDQIALTGQQASGAGEGVVYAELGAATLNRAGDVAFRATLAGPADADTRLAVFGPASGNGSGLTLLAREGDPAPGVADGSVFGRFESDLADASLVLDSFGQVAFYSRLHDPSDLNDLTSGPNAILRSQPETGLVPVVRAGDSVPGLGDGVVFETFLRYLSVNDSGLLQYAAQVSGPGVTDENDEIVFHDSLNGIGEVVVRENELLPGSDDGARLGGRTINSNIFDSLRFNAAGDTAISVRLRDSSSSDTDIGSVILGPVAGAGSELGILFREGDPVPGVSGAVFGSLSSPELYATGELLLVNQMQASPGTSLDEASDEAVFRVMAGSPSSIELLVREGEDAPGIDGDIVLGGQLFQSSSRAIGDAYSNVAGNLVFRSALSSPSGVGVAIDNDFAMFRSIGGVGSSLELVFREGDPAPGQSDGAVFGTDMSGAFGNNGVSYISAMNGFGDFVFVSELRDGEGGPVVDDTNDLALFASISGEVLTILREGDSMEVELAGGLLESRTIASFFEGANDGGEGDSGFLTFNDSGQLWVRVTFTDGSTGLFIAQVPEPAAGVALGLGVCLAAGRRRRSA